MEYKVYTAAGASQLSDILNSLPPNAWIVSIYGIHGTHYAWVRFETKGVKREPTKIK